MEIEKTKGKRFCEKCANENERNRKRNTWHKIKNNYNTSENKHIEN